MFGIDEEIGAFGYIEAGMDASDRDLRACQLYNNAIDDIKAGNADIAFIKLKKAISQKPDFYHAKLLTALYNAKTGSIQKAGAILDDIIRESSEFGPAALKYVRMINSGLERKSEEISLKDEKREHKSELPRKPIPKAAIYLIIGAMIGALSLAPFLGKKAPEADTDDSAAVVESQNEAISGYKRKLSELEVEAGAMKSIIDNLNKRLDEKNAVIEAGIPESEREEIIRESLDDIKAQVAEYLAIQGFYEAGSFDEAADRLIIFAEGNDIVGEASEASFRAFYDEVMNQAARYCEDLGVQLFEQRRYDQSLVQLEKALIYKPDYTRIYRVVYYTGRNLMLKRNYNEAILKFQEVVRIAPNSDWVGYANQRIEEIEKILGNGQ